MIIKKKCHVCGKECGICEVNWWNFEEKWVCTEHRRFFTPQERGLRL